MTMARFFGGLPLLALSLALALTPAAARADDADAISASPSGRYEAAYKMASLSIGGLALSPALKDLMREQLLNEFHQNADFQALELEYPGLTVAVVDAVLPVAVKQTEKNTPALIERLANLYAVEMTADDVVVATEWFASPAFSRISAAMVNNMDLSTIIKNAMADAESQVSDEELEALRDNSAARSTDKMSSADRAALMRFSATSAFARLEALKTRTGKIQTDWTNEDHPTDNTELEDITLKTMEDFTGENLVEVCGDGKETINGL